MAAPLGRRNRDANDELKTDSSGPVPKTSIVQWKKTHGEKRELIMHSVRTGSFQCYGSRQPKTYYVDEEDCRELQRIAHLNTVKQLINYCNNQCELDGDIGSLPIVARQFMEAESHFTRKFADDGDYVKIFQWNILSQALGLHCDGFSTCSKQALEWSVRKWKLIYEMLQYMPLDVICLQEVDHYDFIASILSRLGFEGKFVPKPDSPCYYMSENSGPDGCAIFYNVNRLTLLSSSSRVLRVLDYPTNQVGLCCTFRCNLTGRVFCAATTHLKARKGPINESLRDEQGKDLLKYLSKECANLPLILTGDFNADPSEAVYTTMTNHLSSAYCDKTNGEPIFTNWTARRGEETKHTVDYIFHTETDFKVSSLLSLSIARPAPNYEYPSDHLSLVARLKFC